MEQFFKRQGWQVKRTSGKGGYGADLILTSATKKVVIQVKRWKMNAGYEAIQQAYTSKDVYGCVEAWVITNSGFKAQAKDSAKRLGVKLWDREVLIEKMSKVNAAQTINSTDQEPESENAISNVVFPINPEKDLYIFARCGKPVTNKTKEFFCLTPNVSMNEYTAMIINDNLNKSNEKV
ncbi:restriction endonuclease [Paenibacillus sp. FSL R5-0914]|uniref:restriction endonuclease n=1 Tax=Paenibacillus sp. FSL R5-0914 TaxID=2921665 RepID=UPI0030FBC521